jgi:hypothetical protein
MLKFSKESHHQKSESNFLFSSLKLLTYPLYEIVSGVLYSLGSCLQLVCLRPEEIQWILLWISYHWKSKWLQTDIRSQTDGRTDRHALDTESCLLCKTSWYRIAVRIRQEFPILGAHVREKLVVCRANIWTTNVTGEKHDITDAVGRKVFIQCFLSDYSPLPLPVDSFIAWTRLT